MSDRHKFRFWDTKYNVMIPWDCICQTAFNCLQQEGNTWQRYGLMYDCFTNTMRYICLPFIGKLDRNGKEIYEGDVLSWKEHRTVAVITWSDKHTAFHTDIGCGVDSYQLDLTDCKVIGNIYENSWLKSLLVNGGSMLVRIHDNPEVEGYGSNFNLCSINDILVYFDDGSIEEYSPSQLDVYLTKTEEWKYLTDAFRDKDVVTNDENTFFYEPTEEQKV